MTSNPFGGSTFIRNSEYDFMIDVVRGSDTSNLTVYYVTHDSRTYTIVATNYEEALAVAGFTEEDTTKDDEGVY